MIKNMLIILHHQDLDLKSSPGNKWNDFQKSATV